MFGSACLRPPVLMRLWSENEDPAGLPPWCCRQHIWQAPTEKYQGGLFLVIVGARRLVHLSQSSDLEIFHSGRLEGQKPNERSTILLKNDIRLQVFNQEEGKSFQHVHVNCWDHCILGEENQTHQAVMEKATSHIDLWTVTYVFNDHVGFFKALDPHRSSHFASWPSLIHESKLGLWTWPFSGDHPHPQCDFTFPKKTPCVWVCRLV